MEYEEKNHPKLPNLSKKKHEQSVKDNENYRIRNTFVPGSSAWLALQQVERNRDAIAYTNKIQKRAIKNVTDLLRLFQIEAIKNTPDILPGIKTMLTEIIHEDLRQWLCYEFASQKECPFCTWKFLNEPFTREHIDQKHLAHFTEKAIEKLFRS